MGAWIVLVTAGLFFGLKEIRMQLHDLHSTKANVASLERTNCGLKQFLVDAGDARLKIARDTANARVKHDALLTAKAYRTLAHRFTAVGRCKIHHHFRH